MKKYELTSEKKNVSGRTLYRIRALRDFTLAKKGELGGWIESEYNLYHSGDAWVSGEAEVSGCACVSGDAVIFGRAKVDGAARVYGKSLVGGHSHVTGNTQIYDRAQVSGEAWVSGEARCSGNAIVCEHAVISENAHVSGNAHCDGNGIVKGYAVIEDHAHISGNALVTGYSAVFWVGGLNSAVTTATFFACTDRKIRVTCGTFFGDLEAYAEYAETFGKGSRESRVADLAIELARERIVFPDDLCGKE